MKDKHMEKIFLLIQDKVLHDLLAEYLVRRHFEIVECRSEETILQDLLNEKPGILLIDYHYENHYHLLDQAEGQLKPLKVIVLCNSSIATHDGKCNVCSGSEERNCEPIDGFEDLQEVLGRFDQTLELEFRNH